MNSEGTQVVEYAKDVLRKSHKVRLESHIEGVTHSKDIFTGLLVEVPYLIALVWSQGIPIVVEVIDHSEMPRTRIKAMVFGYSGLLGIGSSRDCFKTTRTAIKRAIDDVVLSIMRGEGWPPSSTFIELFFKRLRISNRPRILYNQGWSITILGLLTSF